MYLGAGSVNRNWVPELSNEAYFLQRSHKEQEFP